MGILKDISLRPIRPSDESYLLSLFMDVRRLEWEMLPLEDARKTLLFQSQQAAQLAHYKNGFPDAGFFLILYRKTRAGRFFTSSGKDGERILDIALHSSVRGMGIGTALLKDYAAESHAAGKPVRLSVEKTNPALRLYRRLGFQIVSEQDIVFEMILAPESVEKGHVYAGTPAD